MKIKSIFGPSILLTLFCIVTFGVLTPFITNRPWSEILESTKHFISPQGSSDSKALSSSKTISSHTFEIIFQPAIKRLTLINGSNSSVPSDIEIAEAEKLLCYELRISNLNYPDILKEPNPRSFEERVKYFSSGIQKNISLILNKDTIPCAMVQLERNFGVAPYLSIQMAFASVENWKTTPHHLIINDEYFGLGEIHLENKIKETEL
jgi:hypothetical protein